MSDPHGIVVCNPANQFNFPRSYVTKLKVFTNHVNSVNYSGGLITWGHIPPDAVDGQTKLKDNFIAWSSNVYSLDYLVEWWWFRINPDPTKIEWGGECNFKWDATLKTNVIEIATAAADTVYYYDLPPSPPSYWLPSPY